MVDFDIPKIKDSVIHYIRQIVVGKVLECLLLFSDSVQVQKSIAKSITIPEADNHTQRFIVFSTS